MLTESGAWVDKGVTWFTKLWGPGAEIWPAWEFNIYAMLAILLVGLVCGATGSLVVGNRMSFFSDALAHCAFAGVAIGLLIAMILRTPDGDFKEWILLIMVGFGVIVGLGIAWVKERTALASDTVIGVFFAGAIGLGAVVISAVRGRKGFQLEQFLFGAPLEVRGRELCMLFGLLVITVLVLCWLYNPMVFTSFNASLARSRRVRIRLCNYLFIALLGIIVNLCLQIVGALIINALLIVPAATAANLSRNLRQMFWWSVGLCIGEGVVGQLLNWEINNATGAHFGLSGTIVVLSVMLFFVSMAVGPALKSRPATASSSG
jgi:zinc transport system permease protein